MTHHNDPEPRRLAIIIRAVADAAIAAGVTRAQLQALGRELAPRLAQLELNLPEADDDDYTIIASRGWLVLSDHALAAETYHHSLADLASLAIGSEVQARDGKVFTNTEANRWKGPASSRGTTAETAA